MKYQSLVLTITLFNVTLGQAEEFLKVYQSTEPIETPSPLAGLHLDTNQTSVQITKGLTFCVRFNYKILSDASQLFRIENSQWGLLWFKVGYQASFFGLGTGLGPDTRSNWIIKDLQKDRFRIWAANSWHHVCIAYDKKTSRIALVKDGEVTNANFVDTRISKLEIPADFLQSFYLGRCYWEGGSCSSHAGSISDANVWDYPLNLNQMKAWTKCQTSLKGNLVDWTSAKWSVINMAEKNLTSKELCQVSKLGTVLMRGGFNSSAAKIICQQLGGESFVVTSEAKQNALMTLFRQSPKCLSLNKIWTGWTDAESEGTFVDVNDGLLNLTANSFSPWNPGEPNGDVRENCIISWEHGDWNDQSCDDPFCVACNVNERPVFIMKGLCYGTKFDIHYGWTGEMAPGSSEMYSFRGFSTSYLFWDESRNEWKLTLYSDPNTYAINNSTDGGYPFGTFNWYFFNDSCKRVGSDVMIAENTYLMPISLSTCTKELFNCRDGTCVDIEARCDGHMDCPDKSDEEDCQQILFDSAYFNDTPAPSIKNQDRLQLFLSTDIINIHELNEVKSLMKLQLRLYLIWLDSRLTFYNLNSEDNLNTISVTNKKEMWMPELVFYNTKEMSQATFQDDESFATKSTMTLAGHVAKFSVDSVHNLKNRRLFKGKDCPIKVYKYFTVDFKCQFDMSYYPFDTQKCPIVIAMKGNTGYFVELVKGDLENLGPKDMMQYVIKHIGYVENKSLNNTITIEFKLGRRILSEILTTILPTMLIIMVSFSTNHFSPQHFEAIVTVNLTALLVMATLFISVSAGLPRTSYLKMIDAWLLYTLSVPFTEVVLHTFMDMCRCSIQDLLKVDDSTIGDWVSQSSDLATIKGKPLDSKILLDNYNKRLRIAIYVTRYGLPITFVLAVVLFFSIGHSFVSQET